MTRQCRPCSVAGTGKPDAMTAHNTRTHRERALRDLFARFQAVQLPEDLDAPCCETLRETMIVLAELCRRVPD